MIEMRSVKGDNVIDNKIKCFAVLVLLIAGIFTVSFCTKAQANLEEEAEISQSEAVKIVEEAGYEVPYTVDISLEEDIIGRTIWQIFWQNESKDKKYLFEVDAKTGEIVTFLVPPKDDEPSITDENEAVRTALNYLKGTEQIEVPEEIIQNDSYEVTNPEFIIKGWRIRFDEKVKGLDIRNSHIIIEISEAGDVIYYLDQWQGIDPGDLSKNDVISETEAIKKAKEWVNTKAPGRIEKIVGTATGKETELVIERPIPYLEEGDVSEKEPTLLYRVYFTREDSYVAVQIDAHTGEYLGMSRTRSWPRDAIEEEYGEKSDGSNNLQSAAVIGVVAGAIIIAGVSLHKYKKQKES